ncbi:MAG: carbamoyltransferase C-terminal domain-containing protein [Candidatus Krumholzibacteriia bacterium]
MLVLGLHDGKDAGVALLDGGKILFAANEERYSRRKLHFGFPFLSLERMFRHTGVSPKDIQAVTAGFEAMVENSEAYYDYSAEPRLHQKVYSVLVRSLGPLMNTRIAAYGSLQLMRLISQNKEELEQNVRNTGIDAPIHYMNHHMSHAASAYHVCGKDDAIIISSDGGGDGISGGVYVGRQGTIKNDTTFSKLNSAGIFWEIITQICGFNPERHGGKITGLAAYSDGEESYQILSELYGYCRRSGGFENRGQRAFQDAFNLVRKRVKHLGIEELSAGCQRLLDEVFVQTTKDALERHGIPHVCLAGGTFANVRTNLKIREVPGVESVFVFPHMGDGGIALASALLFHGQKERLPVQEITDLYWGDEWTEAQIAAELDSTPGIRWQKLDDPEDAIADALSRKEVVGTFHGRMEYGPRALGHRSIIAEPTDTSMMDWLNKRLARTEFMPFAPIILEEEAPNYFVDFDGMQYPAKFMTICMHCTPLCREKAPGVVHIDGTARPQTVRADVDPFLHRVLSRYRDKTGLPLAINTSFNKHEEPIVGSPTDAVSELKRGAVDVLFLESYRVHPEA